MAIRLSTAVAALLACGAPFADGKLWGRNHAQNGAQDDAYTRNHSQHDEDVENALDKVMPKLAPIPLPTPVVAYPRWGYAATPTPPPTVHIMPGYPKGFYNRQRNDPRASHAAKGVDCDRSRGIVTDCHMPTPMIPTPEPTPIWKPPVGDFGDSDYTENHPGTAPPDYRYHAECKKTVCTGGIDGQGHTLQPIVALSSSEPYVWKCGFELTRTGGRCRCLCWVKHKPAEGRQARDVLSLISTNFPTMNPTSEPTFYSLPQSAGSPPPPTPPTPAPTRLPTQERWIDDSAEHEITDGDESFDTSGWKRDESFDAIMRVAGHTKSPTPDSKPDIWANLFSPTTMAPSPSPTSCPTPSPTSSPTPPPTPRPTRPPTPPTPNPTPFQLLVWGGNRGFKMTRHTSPPTPFEAAAQANDCLRNATYCNSADSAECHKCLAHHLDLIVNFDCTPKDVEAVCGDPHGGRKITTDGRVSLFLREQLRPKAGFKWASGEIGACILDKGERMLGVLHALRHCKTFTVSHGPCFKYRLEHVLADLKACCRGHEVAPTPDTKRICPKVHRAAILHPGSLAHLLLFAPRSSTN